MPLAGDASFRRYYRLAGDGGSAVLMDAPPPQEDVGPYVVVAALLRDLGFSAPEVLAEDCGDGFLLLEDFGDDTYTRLLDRGVDEPALYGLAVDTLVALQRAVAARGALGLPLYDVERLLAEAALLVDWYRPLARRLLRDEYLALWRAVLPLAAGSPPTLVLRDYHVDNLMLLPDRPGVRGCGLLDFQDAVSGPPSYDLVSLLGDARRDVPAALRQAMTERYLAAFPALDRSAFLRSAADSRRAAQLQDPRHLHAACGSATASRNTSRTSRGSGACSNRNSATRPSRRSPSGSIATCRPKPGASPICWSDA